MALLALRPSDQFINEEVTGQMWHMFIHYFLHDDNTQYTFKESYFLNYKAFCQFLTNRSWHWPWKPLWMLGEIKRIGHLSPHYTPTRFFFLIFFIFVSEFIKKFWVILFTDNMTEYQAQMQTLTTSLAEVMWCGFRLLHSTRCNTFTKVLMSQWKRIVLQANETLYTVKGKYMVRALASGVAHTALHKYHTSSCTFFPCAF